MHQPWRLLKIFFIFLWTPEHWTRPLNTIHLCLPGEMEHKVPCFKHARYQRHTHTDAGKGKGHRSKTFVIQMNLFTRNILKVWLAGKLEAMAAKRPVGVTGCLTFWSPACLPCLQAPNVSLFAFPSPSPAGFLSVLMQRTGAICLCFNCGILMSIRRTVVFHPCCWPHIRNILVNTPGPF